MPRRRSRNRRLGQETAPPPPASAPTSSSTAETPPDGRGRIGGCLHCVWKGLKKWAALSVGRRTSSAAPRAAADPATGPAAPKRAAAISYQRLEFVGDSALGLAFSNFLYLTNPTLGPGPLSTLRAANISTEKLARVAVRHDLYPLLRRNCPRLDLLVGQFIETVKQEPEDDLGTVPYGGSVVKAPKVLADIVEAIAAAVYVDCEFDLEKLWKVTRWLFEPIITAETIDEQPVTMLHELCQKYGKTAQFKTWQKGGMTVVNVFVAGELVGIGSSEQKVIAKLNAARDAIGKLAGAKQQVLTIGVGNGLGDEIGELRECKQKLNEQCSRQNWPKPIFKWTLSSLHFSSFFPFLILSKAEQRAGRKLGDWVVETESWQLELERWGGAAAVSSVAGEQWGCKLDRQEAAMTQA